VALSSYYFRIGAALVSNWNNLDRRESVVSQNMVLHMETSAALARVSRYVVVASLRMRKMMGGRVGSISGEVISESRPEGRLEPERRRKDKRDGEESLGLASSNETSVVIVVVRARFTDQGVENPMLDLLTGLVPSEANQPGLCKPR